MTSTTQYLQGLTQLGDARTQLALADGSALNVQQVVRIVPNKRVVCRCEWRGQAVFAKIFHGAGAAKYATRDALGVSLLQDANIATPKILYQGHDASKLASVLVLEAIDLAHTAEDLWVSANLKARFDLAKKLVAEVAKHHRAGLLQTDLYLKNFLLAGEIVYTLDGDGIRHCKRLSNQRTRQNLAELISKFDVLEQAEWLPDLLTTYHAHCESTKPFSARKVAALANQHRLKMASAYADKKVFRTCTDVVVARPQGNFLAIASPPNLAEYDIAEMGFTAEALDDLIAQSQHRLKSGNSATVIAMGINDRVYALKRYNIKDAWHGLKRALQPSRAAVSWANAHRLSLLGIATAKPVMLLELRKLSLRGKAYFISEYLDAPDALQFFIQERDKLKRSEAVRNICTLFYRLYLLQISHGDMKATNIKMRGTEPVLIDLDAMQQHRTYFRSSVAHLSDLNRFMQNWQNDAALYNAFVKTFKVVYPDISILVKAGIFQNKELTE